MSTSTKRISDLVSKGFKDNKYLNKSDMTELARELERLSTNIKAQTNLINTIERTTKYIDITVTEYGTLSVYSGGALQLNGNTLTMAGNATVSGTNTGDVTLATNSGLSLSSQVLNMGTPGSVTSSSTNAVTTNTHTHAADSTLARSAITHTAGAGLTGGGDHTGNSTFAVATADTSITVNADSIQVGIATNSGLEVSSGLKLGTPTTLTVSSTNSITTTTHAHAITSSASVTTTTQTLLATDGSGVLRLYRLGIGTAPDSQYDLDVAGSIHTSSYFVGKAALEIEGAIMLAHYDGQRPYETDFTGETMGHMGQYGTVTGGVIFRPGVYGKGVQIAEAATNLWTNPSIETNTTGYTGTGATISQSSTYSKYGTYSLKCITNNAAGAEGWYTPLGGAGSIEISAETSYVMSLYVYGTSGSVYPQIRWYLSDGTYMSASTGSAYTLTSAAGWQKIVHIATSPALAAKAAMLVRTSTQQSTTFYSDEISFYAGTYSKCSLDGSLGSGHTWSGTAHASTSARTAAVLSYTNPLLASAGTLMLHWVPSSANTTAQTSPYLFSEGNLKAYYQASDDKIYFTDGTNTISTAALAFTADADQFLQFCWGTAGLAIRRYYGTTMDTTVTGATYTAPTLGANLFIGSDTSGANQCNGIIDELGILNRVSTDAEFLAIAKSGAPIFAETSTWAWRAGGNLAWADQFGMWVNDSVGGAVFGVYGATGTKSWGGKTLATGDVLMGQAAASKAWLMFDQSEADLSFGVNTATEFALDGGANLLKFGSDVSAAATTAIAIMGAAQTYNSEALGEGDLLIGDNTASKANVLWDKSAGTLLFRGGTTTQLYVSTDGVLSTKDNRMQFDQNGLILNSFGTAIKFNYLATATNVEMGYLETDYQDAFGIILEKGTYGAELVTNTSFETNTTGWTLTEYDGDGSSTIIRSTIYPHTGLYSIYAALSAGTLDPPSFTLTSDYIAVSAGDLLRFKMSYLKVITGTFNLTATINWYTSGSVLISSYSVDLINSYNKWVEANILLEPAPATTAKLKIVVTASQYECAYSFDDFSLKKVTAQEIIRLSHEAIIFGIDSQGLTATSSVDGFWYYQDNTVLSSLQTTGLNIFVPTTIDVNSTTAMVVEQDGVHDNVWVVDTTHGWVGVNKVPGAYALEVSGTIEWSGNILGANDTTEHDICAGTAWDQGATIAMFGDSHETTPNVLTIFTAGSERIRVTTDGKVGIADSAPGEILDVNGNINCTGVIKVDDVQVIGNRVVDGVFSNSAGATYTEAARNLINYMKDALITHGIIAAS